jgi:hypothetical protein
MSPASTTLNRPAEASTTSPPTGAQAAPTSRKIDTHPALAQTRPPTVLAVVVTWNRRDMVAGAVRALANQRFPLDHLHVVVVDNASTDSTLVKLANHFAPERIVDNQAAVAHEPRFISPPPVQRRNTPGFASLTLIRNADNFGGCGGFNTGFQWAARAVAEGLDLDFIWLVDDDAEVPEGALAQLTGAAQADPAIGIVGSRTVDVRDHQTTIESTIYFDFRRGRFADEPTPDHRLRAAHEAWVATTGGTKGKRQFKGIRDVDVVSACSLLARWSAVEKVGFWDNRYFIYCDDADWCLRFGRAGYRVVCNLDAVVYHTPWNLKLTPARLYYAQRNLVWTMRKLMPAGRLRYATFRWHLAILRQSARAAFLRRPFHARVLLRTDHDIRRNVGGKLDIPTPRTMPEIEALRRAGAAGPGATVLAVCPNKRALARTKRLRQELADAIGNGAMPTWIELVRADVPGAHAETTDRIVYSRRLRSKIKSQLRLLRIRPDALLIFDNACDIPIPRGRTSIHLDRDSRDLARLEPDPPVARLTHAARCLCAMIPATVHALTARPDESGPSKA